MKTFRQFYEERYGSLRGLGGELHDEYLRRLANAFTEYVDEVLAPATLNQGMSEGNKEWSEICDSMSINTKKFVKDNKL